VISDEFEKTIRDGRTGVGCDHYQGLKQIQNNLFAINLLLCGKVFWKDMAKTVKTGSRAQIIIAFAIVYIVWGSTYFFIKKAIGSFPIFLLGGLRFFTAALIMFAWCLYKKENVFNIKQIRNAGFSGLLLLFVGNGLVMWVQQSLPSAVVAITISTAPLWFLLLDKPKWMENLRNPSTIIGLLIGFVGIILLFYKSLTLTFAGGNATEATGMALVTIAAISWAGGSLYSKYYCSDTPAAGNSMWQMLAAAVAFTICSFYRGESNGFEFSSVSSDAWFALFYLIILGSVVGFSAYVWLLEVVPATQVSTYAYVNPVVAVLLGVFFAGERISVLQMMGLTVILGSVLLINISKYRKRGKLLNEH